ncbi:GTPase HflX [Opitutus sp. ER46]|uniref:GTPase HflX n=1 Tax=Opitutus sp. ER46 TaxID=2161864 RepID=UPI000D3115A6|nr:GTPase HflX [Opitutus sp. ER46]PTY00501.1 GTPase HflX [Opitutus sp. ER46]
MADFLTDKPANLQRAFLVGVQTDDMAADEGAELLGELKELVENLRITVARTTLVRLRHANPAMLLGSGKAAEIIELAKADEVDVIIFDKALSPAQQRNWEEQSGLAVIDRQEVILEIFADRAQTREAILQVALARMEYSLPRLTRAWTHLSRQRGKGALGGEGETQLEQDRRIVRDRIAHLKRELVNVVQQRDVQRRKRQRIPVPTCSIVGYTNAGKSTLLNTLTGAQVLAADKLFATLDPTTRQLVLRGNQKVLVTDTVGFIRRLPHDLVEAFKATLEEVIVADFLVHVLDVTNPNVEQHHATTLSVLQELGAAEKTTLTVFNKIDAATPAMLQRARALVPDALFVSARTREGLDALEERCLELIAEANTSTELVVPHARYDVIARLHEVGHVQAEEQQDDGVHLRGRFPPTQAAFFAPFVVKR